MPRLCKPKLDAYNWESEPPQAVGVAFGMPLLTSVVGSVHFLRCGCQVGCWTASPQLIYGGGATRTIAHRDNLNSFPFSPKKLGIRVTIGPHGRTMKLPVIAILAVQTAEKRQLLTFFQYNAYDLWFSLCYLYSTYPVIQYSRGVRGGTPEKIWIFPDSHRLVSNTNRSGNAALCPSHAN